MRRRDFILGLGGVAAWPVAARAQQAALPVIGFLNSGSRDRYRLLLDAFRQGLNDGGYVEDRNVKIVYRWAEGRFARLPELAADLVRRQVFLIASTGGSAAAHAAKDATSEIPVLFIGGPDPVADHLVSSLNRPGGNLTGVGVNTSLLMQKRVQLLLDNLKSAVLERQGDAIRLHPTRSVDRNPRPRCIACSPASVNGFQDPRKAGVIGLLAAPVAMLA
jgi:putative ABC transport system substrate-binding protein